jgi:BirA family biotin operon repressor/biotin-[acetyl-CoA-carboxylase] ligase
VGKLRGMRFVHFQLTKEIKELPPKTNRLRPSALRKRLGTSLFAKNIIYHKAINSTNVLAKELASHGAPEGTLVLAEEQTEGRGRINRVWLSPAFGNLYFTIILRPCIQPDQVFVFTMVLALAASDAVKREIGIRPMIKWPNDLYVERKKLGGILTEFSVKEKAVEYVILGLGLNVNWNPKEEPSLLYPATSIFAETGLRASRSDLLIEILKSYESYYSRVLAGQIDDVYKRWNELSLIKGREVKIHSGQKTVYGKVLKIDQNGALVIINDDGLEEKIQSGDVSIRF